jgi:transposase
MQLKLPLSFIKSNWNRTDIHRKKGSGRPSIQTPSVIHRIEQKLMKKKPESTAQIACADFSQSTVLRVAHKLSLYPYHPRKQLVFSAEHIKKRLAFAKAHKNDDWSDVAYLDEKVAFLIPQSNSKVDIVWAKKGTKVPPINHERHSSKLNVIAVVSKNTKSRLYIFEQNMDSDLLIEALRSTLIPHCLNEIGPTYRLVMDNDPKHTSKKTAAFFEQNNVPNTFLPPKSPDLNIIENVWSMLDQRVKSIAVKTKANFQKQLPKLWDQIPQVNISNCVDSMQRRLQAIISAKGGHTKY